eukprot:14981729-Alexandrium_andersonii.AAC.1
MRPLPPWVLEGARGSPPAQSWEKPAVPTMACEKSHPRLLRAGRVRLGSPAPLCEMARHAPGPSRRA